MTLRSAAHALAFVFVLSGPAHAVPRFDVKVLSTPLPGQGANMTGINDAGKAICSPVVLARACYGSTVTDSWSQLNTYGGGNYTFAEAINSAGYAVGAGLEAGNIVYTGVIWYTGWSAAIEVPGARWARAINDANTVTGDLRNGKAFRWTVGDPAADTLDHLDDMNPGSRGYGINDAGVVVGYSTNQNGIRACYWTGSSPVSLGIDGRCFDINESGDIVGIYHSGSAFHRPSGGGTIQLPSLPGASNTYAYAINDSGWIVGFGHNAAWPHSGYRAALWVDQQIYDLSDRLTDSTWTVVRARAINDEGVIIAIAADSAGTHKALELTPVADPVIRVFADSLASPNLLITDTEFEAGLLVNDGFSDTLRILDTITTDSLGLATLDAALFAAGDPFVLRRLLHTEPSVKANHQDVGDVLYEVWVDNLYLDPLDDLFHMAELDTSGDTTDTYLEHATWRFRLVVSIEWPASSLFRLNLENAFKNVNNYLYDVFNGQVCLEKVVIRDDRTFWDGADIRVHANNTTWPAANLGGAETPAGNLVMPPIWKGDKSSSVDASYAQNPPEPDEDDHVRTIAHELGHYLFGFYDEYITPNGADLPAHANFGMMDDQYEANDVMDSELSEPNQWHAAGIYAQNEQFQSLGKTCWEYFDDTFTAVYGMIPANVRRPNELAATASGAIEGPNDDGNVGQFSVGDWLTVDATNNESSAPGHPIVVVTTNMDSVSGAKVALQKSPGAPMLFMGETNLDGMIRLLGADDGDTAYASGGFGASFWNSGVFVVDAGAGKLGRPQVVAIQAAAGHIDMLSQATADGGGWTYATATNRGFSTAPVLRQMTTSGSSETTLSGDSTGYTTGLVLVGPGIATLRFTADDTTGTPFFVNQELAVHAVSPGAAEVADNALGYTFTFDSTVTGTGRMALLASPFPSPRTGLADAFVRVSPVVSVQTDPDTLFSSGRIGLVYDGGNWPGHPDGAVHMHFWNGSWIPLATSASTQQSKASAPAVAPGLYAVFLDTTLVPTGVGSGDRSGGPIPGAAHLERNMPNPFNPVTTIRYGVTTASPVRLSVYDISGRFVRTLVDEVVHDPGTHRIVWDGLREDGRPAPSGIYLYRLDVDGGTITRRMVLVR